MKLRYPIFTTLLLLLALVIAAALTPGACPVGAVC